MVTYMVVLVKKL